MADQKISDLTLATLPLVGTEETVLRVASDNRRVAVRELIPLGIGQIAGEYFTHQAGQGRGATNMSTASQPANRIELQPFIPQTDLEIDRVGIVTTTGASGAVAKVCLYGSTDRGVPGALIWQSGDLATDATGFVEEVRSYTFERGRLYWLGVRTSISVTLRGTLVAGLIPIGLAGAPASSIAVATCYRRTIAYADPAPSPFVPIGSELISAAQPAIYFRAT